MKSIAAAIAALLLAGTTAAGAQTYVEVGDAGSTFDASGGTAADTTRANTGAPLTRITGTLGQFDADLFKIYIGSPKLFSASTNNAFTNTSYPGGQQLDTALFLFDATGKAIATNDDADGTHVTSTLSTSSPFLANLSAGTYYLGISISGNEAVNSANQLLFNGYTGGATTSTRGPASGLNPVTLSRFDGNAFDGTPGAYQIDLAGVTFGAAPAVVAAVPEPATWTLAIGGLGLAGGALRRRPRAAARLAAA